jgi:CRP-like cAMP-binding protein
MAIKLKDIYIFQDLNNDLINKLIDNSRTIEINAWENVIIEWDQSDNNAYIIKNWIAKVIIWDRVIKTLKNWDIFWEIALITNEPRTATVKALTKLKLLKINKELLHNIIKEFPNWKEIQKVVMERILENTKN